VSPARHHFTDAPDIKPQTDGPDYEKYPGPPMMNPGVAHDRNGRETPVSTMTWNFCHQFPRSTYCVPGIGQIQCP